MIVDSSTANTLDFTKGLGASTGLLPAIVQDASTGRVLMLGFMNRAALDATLASGRATFFSRSKQRLWIKGESSGHYLTVSQIFHDCDRDALLVLAKPDGPTCHLGTQSCFGDAALPLASVSSFVAELDALIASRRGADPNTSYTAKLFAAGSKRIAQKVGEEGVETALAGAGTDNTELLAESADLLYHLLVLLRSRGLAWADVSALLAQRHRAS
jgi:phosphoribosyl-ATP pyrophosphohydrolase/phosphoribosyl-AMP cyclohydrolase